MMDGRPKHTGRVVEITIALDIDHDAIAALCSKRSADGCGSAVAHAARALAAQVTVRLIMIPELDVMTSGKTARRRQAPVFVLDQWPEFAINTGSRDRAGVPSVSLDLHGLCDRLDAGLLIGFGMLRFAFFNNRSFIRGQLPFHFINDERQTCFSIGLNRGIVVRACAATATAAGSRIRTRYDAAESDIRGVAAQQRGETRTDKRSLRARSLQTERVIVTCARTGSAKRMTLRKAHRTICRACARGRTDEFSKLNGRFHALGRSQTSHGNSGVLCIKQSFRNLPRPARIDSCDLRRPVSRNFHVARFFLLKLGVYHH